MKLIDFYSYKGGAGRSVTTLNTIPFIAEALNASPEKPLIVFDMDLESAGITYLVEEDKSFSKNEGIKLKDTRDYFDGEISARRKANSRDESDILKNSIDISKKVGYPNEGSILFMGVDDSDLLKEYPNPADLKKKVSDLITHLKKIAAGIIFDSASGGQPISLALLQKSTDIVVCLKVTSQFRHGTLRFLDKLMFDNDDFDKKNIILLPVAISENEAMANESLTYKELALKDLIDKIEVFEKKSARGGININFNKVFLTNENFGIPEIEKFKWEERNLFFEKSIGRTLERDEEIGFKRYQLLGEELSKEEE